MPLPESPLTGRHHRTLATIFAHPIAHNLDWSDAIGLLTHLGIVQETAHNGFILQAGGQRVEIHKPHGKDLSSAEIMQCRHFLQQAGFAPSHSQATKN